MMRNREVLQSPTVIQTRTQSTNAWMATCHVLASSSILTVAGQNHLAVHSATTGQSLLSLDWNNEMLVVEIAKGARVYLFHDLNGALTFLEGVLLHYAPDQTELRPAASKTPNGGGI